MKIQICILKPNRFAGLAFGFSGFIREIVSSFLLIRNKNFGDFRQMPLNCAVPSCKSLANRRSNEESFFSFPSRTDVRQKWIENLRRAGRSETWSPSRNQRVCGRHFDSACFYPTAQNVVRKYKRLRQTAFPTENMGVPPEELEHNFVVGSLVSTSDLLPASSVSPVEHLDQTNDLDPLSTHDEEPKNKLKKNEESSEARPTESRVKVPSDPMTTEESSDSRPTSSGVKVPSNSTVQPTQEILEQRIRKLEQKNRRVVRENKNLKLKLSRVTTKYKKAKLTNKKRTSAHPSEEPPVLKPKLMDELVQRNELACKRRTFSKAIKNFAINAYFYSPKCFKYLRKHFELPAPRTIRRWTCVTDGRPGFQKEVLEEIQRRVKSEPEIYSQAALLVDGMSIKESIEYANGLKQTIGFADVDGLIEVS